MNSSNTRSLHAMIFEHACKFDLKNTIYHIVESEDLTSDVIPNFAASSEKTVKPIFLFIFLLKKLHSSNILSQVDNMPEKVSQILPIFIDLVQTTFRQCNFISIKKFFTFISELKLLDLLSLIVKNLDSSSILQKLNQHFPRWTSAYKAAMEKDFCIDNSKILVKVEESHAQCRRLILKLAVDLTFRTKYMSEQYSNDIERIIKETREFITESLNALQSSAAPSLLEMTLRNDNLETKDLSTQLLFEYIQPEVTDESLVKFLEDLEPTLNPHTTSGLSSCLLPFDSMSEDEESESDCEFSQSGLETN